MFNVNNRNIRTSCEICSKLTTKPPERSQWRHSGVFIVNFDQVNAGWTGSKPTKKDADACLKPGQTSKIDLLV